MRLSAQERKALALHAKPHGERSYAGVHANSIHSLQRKGLVKSGRLTAAGRAALKVPDVFADLLPKATPVDADRALAAAEVLAAVWLSEEHFELETMIDDPPIVEQDAEDRVWVTVKVQVPALDVETWLDGTHVDHPDNVRSGSGEAP